MRPYTEELMVWDEAKQKKSFSEQWQPEGVRVVTFQQTIPAAKGNRTMDTVEIEIIGRSSSLFTRVARIFAEELDVPYRLTPVPDMTVLSAHAYGGNPAMKLPVLRMDSSILFGAENICRAFAERSRRHARIVWPEDHNADVLRNAQELVLHAMAAQVQISFGVVICKLPADNVYFVKAREGLEGALGWLNVHLAEVREHLPVARDLSLLEVLLFCLVDHLSFRSTVSITPYTELTRFVAEFASRPSTTRTPYRFDS